MNEQKALEQIVGYMKAHWPSKVKPEWQVGLEEYSLILQKVVADVTAGKTREKNLIRIAGVSGSGKTTQLLPAVQEYTDKKKIKPVLVAARVFAPYHPHYQEIVDYYGEAEVRKLTDEFSTIMLFLVIAELIKSGFDVVLDVTLLDPAMEKILMQMVEANKYNLMILMIAVSPEVTERHLGERSWRHTRETELEFIRATEVALKFYTEEYPDNRIIIWNTYEENPVYDGVTQGSYEVFKKYSEEKTVPAHDTDKLKQAKIAYLTKDLVG